MHRFFADENGIGPGGEARLAPEDERHARQVLRLREGDEVVLYAGGGAYRAVVAQTQPFVTLRAQEALPSPEPTVRVTLYQGVSKGERMDYTVQKCTEAGVAAIVPVNMPRSVARLEGAGAQNKLQRWQKIAREAAKQAFRPVTPQVRPALSLGALPGVLREHQLVLVPWEDEHTQPLRTLLRPDIRDIALVIGPEGGMSGEDVALLREAGGQTVTLGPRIFRTETAGLAALIAIMTLTGNLE